MIRSAILDIPEGGCRRIKNAAIRIKRTIYVVGSRAKNTATNNSDFDYVIFGLRSKEWQKIKNSLPGAKDNSNNLQRRIDIFKGQVDVDLPNIEITPNLNIDECRR